MVSEKLDPSSAAAAGDIDRLRRMLGTPETAWLLNRLRERLERTGSLGGVITKQSASAAERAAAARLLGRAVRAGTSASVIPDDLDVVLRRSEAWPPGLASAVVALTGPITDPVTRQAERDNWRAANDTLLELGRRRPELAAWAARSVQSGVLKRATATATEARHLADRLVGIADALPVDADSLGVFSARVLGDAHALDRQTTLGALATGLAAALGSQIAGPVVLDPESASPVAQLGSAQLGSAQLGSAQLGSAQLDPESGSPLGQLGSAQLGSAQGRRDAWQSVGIVIDELSSTVLTLGLPGGSGSPTARVLAELHPVGQPVVLTLRQLLSDSPGEAPPVVFICENPAVVAAAAARIGSRSAPVICVSGQPGAAALTLLRGLAAGGSRFRYHGDFDPGGMAVARTLARHIRWHPWRFSANDYEQAVATAGVLMPFAGSPGLTAWDPPLEDSMTRTGLRVEEELVIDSLMTDLDLP